MAGFNLPPGVTSRMIDEAYGIDQPCAVCCKDPADCICPECPQCGTTGDPNCYCDSSREEGQRTGHGLRLSKEQLISRQETRVHMARQHLANAEMVLGLLQEQELNEDLHLWDLRHSPDPWK
jgi:hypothetical protein